ncbi:Hypothetical predicted protein [Mytilus galloprovincialis]|uniref:Endonuclease/exonuclease/phosphatase domain-containing protein n=1 Tax=Mytilus galloprovincialis TaxID=29158 RepID=A0A8B6CKB8_MYTGA|nr:Hypothetical predicted protein [Mytilus galloprovincialis]
MAGTAMLWSNKITEKITVLNEGSHRISAVTLSDDILDFNLYCVYMPCQNYSMDLFESTLDELGEIMTKYSNSTTIILGDMNASVNRSKGYRQDKALKSFLNEKHLSVPKDYPEEHTYYHHGGKQSSQIDYIVISSTQIDKISDIKVMIDEPLNTSSHSIFSFIEMSCEELFNILTTTAFECAPTISVGKRKRSWNSVLQQLCKQSKDAHWKWKSLGSPSDINDPANRKRLDMKRELRKLQRQLNAEERHSLYQNIMDAHSGDNATFYKIIRRQRQSGKRLLDCLIIDDVHFDTPDLIREAWTNYFTDLSTPSEKPQNQQYRSQVELDRILLQDILEHEDEKTIEFDIGTIQKCISKMKTGKATDQFGISAEHFKYGGEKTAKILTNLINEAFKFKRVPQCFKEGIVSPLFKRSWKTYLPTKILSTYNSFSCNGKIDGIGTSLFRGT